MTDRRRSDDDEDAMYAAYVPRVSEIIHGARSNGSGFGPAAWGERGTAVHAYAAALDLGSRLPRLPLDWQPYVDGYIEFLAAMAEEPRPTGWEHVERPFIHRGLKYRGTPDRIGTLCGSPAVVDLKTGERSKWHGLQLAAYDLLVPAPVPRQRWVVYLPGDGTFRLEHYDDPDDYSEFLTRLSAWHASA